jgi:hypothetical protein
LGDKAPPRGEVREEDLEDDSKDAELREVMESVDGGTA